MKNHNSNTAIKPATILQITIILTIGNKHQSNLFRLLSEEYRYNKIVASKGIIENTKVYGFNDINVKTTIKTLQN